MRGLTGREQVERFMRALGQSVRQPTRVYLLGGASAVLFGWRETTIDVDLTFVPEGDEVFQAIARLKNELGINVELVSPSDFPSAPGWETRSLFIRQEGPVAFYHYDFYSQALAKIERAHAKDLGDVADMVKAGVVEPDRLRELFDRIVPDLPRYPALNLDSFRRSLNKALDSPDPI